MRWPNSLNNTSSELCRLAEPRDQVENSEVIPRGRRERRPYRKTAVPPYSSARKLSLIAYISPFAL